KIKSGNFNMVQIYLDGLTPRVQKMWDKLGKKPEKLQIQLLDAAEMDAELAKARAEKAQAAAKEKAEGGGAGGAGGAAQSEEEETKVLTPEKITEKEGQITELQGQIDTALERGDKNMANELYNELPPIINDFPAAKKKEWEAKFAEMKKKIG
ncbi:hypothetical protein KY362_07065, partial [Candidatus Woesearchaeota archaeon]|nr:hypothetical protein [Candidatus Woesearchaeota archaeon]